MKYIHIPKVKNIVLFGIFVVVSVFLNLPFSLMKNSIIEYNCDMLLIMHIALPIIYSMIFCMLFSYLLFTLESIISNFKSNLQLKVLTFLGVVEICAGIFIVLFAVYQGDGQVEEKIKFLSETIYFKSLLTNEDITSVFYDWIFMHLFSLIISSVI